MASPARVVVALLLITVPARVIVPQGSRAAVPAHVGVDRTSEPATANHTAAIG